MATEQVLTCISLEAAADLSAKQFYIVAIDSNGKCALASSGTASAVYGVLQNTPGSAMPASVAIAGVTKCMTGSALAINTVVVSDSAGKGTALTLGDYSGTVVNYAVGRVVVASAAANGVAEVILYPGGQSVPT